MCWTLLYPYRLMAKGWPRNAQVICSLYSLWFAVASQPSEDQPRRQEDCVIQPRWSIAFACTASGMQSHRIDSTRPHGPVPPSRRPVSRLACDETSRPGKQTRESPIRDEINDHRPERSTFQAQNSNPQSTVCHLHAVLGMTLLFFFFSDVQPGWHSIRFVVTTARLF